jgi:hypothetical protein
MLENEVLSMRLLLTVCISLYAALVSYDPRYFSSYQEAIHLIDYAISD